MAPLFPSLRKLLEVLNVPSTPIKLTVAEPETPTSTIPNAPVLSCLIISPAAAVIAALRASVFLVILNGMWISGNDMSRFSTLISLFKDLRNDILESFTVLFQSFFSEPPSTSNLSEAS